MPNWCENDLEVRYEGENKEEGIKELKRFQEFAQTEKVVLDANKFIPYPQKFKELDKIAEKETEKLRSLSPEERTKQPWPKDGFNQGGYEWCIDNWGTKWGFCEPELVNFEYEYGTLEYSFDTAWSPPIPLIKKMAEMFPILEFELRYFEGAMGFNGLFSCSNGEIDQDLTGEYFGRRGG